MKVNYTELNVLLQEYNALSNKPKHTKQEEYRMAFLQSSISAIKEGASLQELDEQYLNETERRNGLPLTKFERNAYLTREETNEARGWQALIERRDTGMVGGNPISRIGTYTGLGYFVPTDFFPGVFAAMKSHDPLFDEADVTLIKSTNGWPLPVPVADDTENVASVVSEAGSQTIVDIDATGHAVLGAYSYSTPRFVVSMEAFQDLDSSLNAVALYKRFSADRIARGVGADLVNGNGVDKPLGLIPALEALGVSPVTAAGAASNTGGSETGANSLGSEDFQAAYSALSSAYLASDKVAWLMNHSTLASIAGIVNKFGDQLNLVQYIGKKPFIYGIPVKLCPSMDSIGASNVPVVLGDLSYWATRLIVDDMAGIKVYTEAPGLVENGNVGLRTFVRADGVLLYKDTNSPSPFVMIRNHS
jgi:HK97 family phage major capsid protein